jgi:predicted RNA-binding protein with PIN domain
MAFIVIDGYNVIRNLDRFMRAEADSLESGRTSLLMEVEEFGAGSGHLITVVFDGGGYPNQDEVMDSESFAGVDVLFSRRGRSADDEIVGLIDRQRRIASGEGEPVDVVVVTDDGMLRSDATSRGAFVLPTGVFDGVLRGLNPFSY